ncbi:MAG: hypothetical protein ACOYM3_28460 [Terrimicrobiaceae bacterium]
MRGIAQRLAEVGAPDALLLQLTNPQMYCRIENGKVIRPSVRFVCLARN